MAELRLKVQWAMENEIKPLLYIPPPLVLATFPLKIQLVIVGLLSAQYIPPPLVFAIFPLNVQLVTIGLLLF